jgi:hypothetical protein
LFRLTKLKLLIAKVNEIEQNWTNNSLTAVHYFHIVLKIVGYSTTLKTLDTLCRILSTNAKVSMHFHSKFIQYG